MTSRRWTTTTKIIVASALALLAVGFLVAFRQMIAPTIVAFLLAFVLSYPVNWVQQRTGWPRGLSVISTYVMVVIGLVLVVIIIMPRMDTMSSSLRQTIEDLASGLQSGVGLPAIDIGPIHLSGDELLAQAGSLLSGLLAGLTTNPGGIVRGVTTSLVNLIYVVVLNYWLLKDSHKLQRAAIGMIPADYQEEMRRLGGELSDVWQGFLRGQILLGIVVGLIVWVCLLILGMPNAAGLALLAGIMELLPSIGPAISGSIATILAFFYGSTWMPVSPFIFAIIVSIVYSIIGQIESVYFIPRLVGGRVKLHPGVTFVGIMAGAMVFGVLGILLAAPVIASARIILAYISRKLTDREPFEDDRTTQSALRIPGVIAGRKIDAIIFDLDGALAPIDTAAVDWAREHFDIVDRVITPNTRVEVTRRTMTALEAPINFTLNMLWRWNWHDMIERVQPTFDMLRAYPSDSTVTICPETAVFLRRLSSVYKLGLVSTRLRPEVNGVLIRSGLDQGVFDAIVAREDAKNIQPSVDPLQKLATLLRVAPEHMLIVSDTDVGLRSARAAEMATAGVTSGLALADNFVDADIVVATVPDLEEYL
jgi:predicted PurR-regulated permease PerM/phosphoglycolate phosphatase-like HAD superfamily hydrolase